MLRWRLLLGGLIIALLAGLCWLDHWSSLHSFCSVPGLWLLPVAVFFAVGATHEVLALANGSGMRPVRWAVYGGNLLVLASNWLPPIGCRPSEPAPRLASMTWPFLALAVGVLVVLIAEMRRYEKPGRVTADAAAAVFALVYVGVMLSFAVQLRVAPWGGIAALASLIIVAKSGDTGAYTVGRLIGRHKMSPVLSPGKTIEGAIGALLFACLGSWATFRWVVDAGDQSGSVSSLWWGWVLFGLVVGGMGLLGDLAESMLKRDAGQKDSSSWLPGLGGVLDIVDSILLAAPVAWLCWALGLVGR